MKVFTTTPSPIGTLTLAAEDGMLTDVLFEDNRYPPDQSGWQRDDADPVLRQALRQLAEYFAGTRRAFDLPLAARGTSFQQQVWAALTHIPFGETRSYGQQARMIENDKAVRAVGLANGKNPIPIIIPCHRVIGANGSLTGFGGGLPRKQWLLAHESRLAQGSLFG